jgi:hypothetical protein
LILALSAGTGCIASNVVADQDRAVRTPVDELEWRQVTAGDVLGLFESVDVTGAAADSLWKIWYFFEEGGQYTAAALVATADGMRFQVTEGVWELSETGIALDGNPPTPISASTDHLRLQAPNGLVVLRRSVLH